MEKSRLGISINLFAALLYFIGATGSGVLVIVVAAGYVLLCEESERLKKTAAKSLILIVCLSILSLLAVWISSSLSNTFGVMSNFNVLVSQTNNWRLYQFLQYIPLNISSIARVIEIIIPVIFGLSAYKEKDIKIKWIDNIIDKHFIHE